MLQKIPCFCDNTFSVDIPEEIDLDKEPGRLDEILNGTFLNYTCSGCGKKHKPEFNIRILWPSKKVELDVFTELDRGEFYRRKKDASTNKKSRTGLERETIIGYPELADRLMVIRDNLEPAAIEAIKYFLHLKAEEQYPEEEMDIWYNGVTSESSKKSADRAIEFHIHGIRKDEVAVMRIPFSLYEKYHADFKKNPKSEIFTALRVRTYLSVKNTMRPEVLK